MKTLTKRFEMTPRHLFCAVMAFLSVTALSMSAAASTLQESSVAGGDFSGDWRNFSNVGFGSDSITGTWFGGNDYDFLAFTNLAKGAQSITLTFSPITSGQGYSFSAGGSVRYKTSPLKYSAWEGDTLGDIRFDYYNQSTAQTLTLALDDAFEGSLYLQLYGTYGALQYGISAPGNALASLPASGGGGLASAVPVPGAVAMLLSGLAALFGLGALGKRQQQKA